MVNLLKNINEYHFKFIYDCFNLYNIAMGLNNLPYYGVKFE